MNINPRNLEHRAEVMWLSGKWMKITDMDTSHILNCINTFFYRNSELNPAIIVANLNLGITIEDFLQIFVCELHYRNGTTLIDPCNKVRALKKPTKSANLIQEDSVVGSIL